jgi:hypothetical protein
VRVVTDWPHPPSSSLRENVQYLRRSQHHYRQGIRRILIETSNEFVAVTHPLLEQFFSSFAKLHIHCQSSRLLSRFFALVENGMWSLIVRGSSSSTNGEWMYNDNAINCTLFVEEIKNKNMWGKNSSLSSHSSKADSYLLLHRHKKSEILCQW